jgi:GNAT superfamily N-acetyltransferase
MDSISSLENVPFVDIHGAFTDAFSEYEVPMNLPMNALEEMLDTRSYRADFSFGYFVDGRLISFILVGLRSRKGILTAYDSGTGTVKTYQGKGIGSRLLGETIRTLKSRKVQRFVLEVLEHNASAQTLYKRHGFEVTRKLNCYKRAPKQSSPGLVLENRDLAEEYGDRIELITFRPSWQNELESYRNSSEKHVVIAEGEIDGVFGIVHRQNGAILQLGLGPGDLGKEKEERLFYLLEQAAAGKGLKYLNVESSSKVEEVLLRNGFELYASQYEMACDM